MSQDNRKKSRFLICRTRERECRVGEEEALDKFNFGVYVISISFGKCHLKFVTKCAKAWETSTWHPFYGLWKHPFSSSLKCILYYKRKKKRKMSWISISKLLLWFFGCLHNFLLDNCNFIWSPDCPSICYFEKKNSHQLFCLNTWSFDQIRLVLCQF